MRMFILLMGLW